MYKEEKKLSGGILLTQQSGILKPIAILLGYLMEGIFFVIDALGIPNIGLAIIYHYYLWIDDTAYHQAAEIFQAFCQDESGTSGNSEKI